MNSLTSCTLHFQNLIIHDMVTFHQPESVINLISSHPTLMDKVYYKNFSKSE